MNGSKVGLLITNAILFYQLASFENGLFRCKETLTFILETNEPNDLSDNQFVSNQPLSAEEIAYYEECKEYHGMTGRPLISVSDAIFDDNFGGMPTLLKLGIDRDVREFNLRIFLDQITRILPIDISDIEVVKIQRGSIIIETELCNKFQLSARKLKVAMIIKSFKDEFQRKLGEIKVFFMFMGTVQSYQQMQHYRNEIKLHPEWNRTYGRNASFWTGKLSDGRDRGPEPYYCPVGWKRHSLYVTENFETKFKGWCICYHGTKFLHGLSILLSGLKPAECAAHGPGIYVSPSIKYACHPRYSEVKRIVESTREENFKAGQYVQFVLECRVDPTSIKKKAVQTLGANGTVIDSNISNDEIEWLIDSPNNGIAEFGNPNSSIMCTGIMMRVTDNHPGLLSDSRWWHTAHLCGAEACCQLGIALEDLKKKKSDGEVCQIVLS